MAQKLSTPGVHTAPRELPPKPKSRPNAQNSSFYNLYLLGRIPFAMEGTLWCFLGSMLYSPRSSVSTSGTTAAVLSASIVFLTNVSINYANEYFDFEADSILASRSDDQDSHGGTQMLVDGTFKRHVAFLCAAVVQVLIIFAILISRRIEGPTTHLQGFALWLIVALMVAGHQYVGPPLRLHYRGGGELITSIIVSSGTVLYGYLAQVTVSRKEALGVIEAWECTNLALILFLAWAFFFELSRVFMMHVADIAADRLAKKNTLVSILGHENTTRLYLCTTVLHLCLACKLIAFRPKAGYLMVPMMIYSIPIAFKVLAAMSHLTRNPGPGRKEFAVIPMLVSLQTLSAPVLFMSVTLLVGNCLG